MNNEIKALPCVVCGRDLYKVGLEFSRTQPYGGTNFSSFGHYGSTAFDPIDGSQISINLCDICLSQAKRKQQVIFLQSERGIETTWT